MNHKSIVVAALALLCADPSTVVGQGDAWPLPTCGDFTMVDRGKLRRPRKTRPYPLSTVGTRLHHAFMAGNSPWVVVKAVKTVHTDKFVGVPFSSGEPMLPVERRLLAIHPDGRVKQLHMPGKHAMDYDLDSHSLVLRDNVVIVAQRQVTLGKHWPLLSKRVRLLQWQVDKSIVETIGDFDLPIGAESVVDMLTVGGQPAPLDKYRATLLDQISQTAAELADLAPSCNRDYSPWYLLPQDRVVPGFKPNSLIVYRGSEKLQLAEYPDAKLGKPRWYQGKAEILAACGLKAEKFATYWLSPAYGTQAGDKMLPLVLRVESEDGKSQLFELDLDQESGKFTRAAALDMEKLSCGPVLSPNRLYVATLAEKNLNSDEEPQQHLFVRALAAKTTRTHMLDGINWNHIAGVTNDGQVICLKSSSQIISINPAADFRQRLLFELLPALPAEERKGKE